MPHVSPSRLAYCGRDESTIELEPETKLDTNREPQTEQRIGEVSGLVSNLMQMINNRWEAWDLSDEDKKGIATIGLSSTFLFLYGLASLSRGLIIIGLLGLGLFFYSSDRKRLKRLKDKLHQE